MPGHIYASCCLNVPFCHRRKPYPVNDKNDIPPSDFDRQYWARWIQTSNLSTTSPNSELPLHPNVPIILTLFSSSSSSFMFVSTKVRGIARGQYILFSILSPRRLSHVGTVHIQVSLTLHLTSEPGNAVIVHGPDPEFDFFEGRVVSGLNNR